MAFGNFTESMVERDLGLTITEADLFSHVDPVAVRPDFSQHLQPGIDLARAIDNEMAKSAFIIAPVLLELREMMGRSFGLFTAIELSADVSRGLTGFCDYLLTKSPVQMVARGPLVTIIEAKNDNIHSGLWQAIATTYSLGLINRNEGHPVKAAYGAITTGNMWQFIRVDETTVTFDSTQYLISDLGKIFGILKHIIETA